MGALSPRRSYGLAGSDSSNGDWDECSASNAGRTTINFTLTASNAVNIQAAHIHLGDPGVAGPILIPLSNAPFTSPLTGTLTDADLNPNPANGINTLSDAIDAIAAGRTYVNVHTTANPAGEIRGQIQPQ